MKMHNAASRVFWSPCPLLLALIFLTPPARGDAVSDKILAEAEAIRAPDQGKSKVALRSVQGDSDITYQLDVLMGTRKRAFLDFKGPLVEKGRKMLLLDGGYWSRFPNSKKVIPISRREAIGNSTFALADIFRLDRTEYDSKIEGEEKIDGKPVTRLALKAKNASVPYAAVKYFVEKQGSFPIKAQFFGPSGKHLKSLYVEERKQLGKRVRASIVRMDDEVTAGRKSWWKTENLTEEEIPEEVFTTEFLLRE